MPLNELLSIINHLCNADGGCPWHNEQTHKSLSHYAIEEAYELTDAIENNSIKDIKDELGDTLLQVLLHSKIAEKEGKFTFKDVCTNLSDKLKSRQPYMFSGEDISELTSKDVFRLWDENKAKQKKAENTQDNLSDIINALPALLRAQKIQKKAAEFGFEWRARSHIVDKLDEEIEELNIELQDENESGINEELGDVLFVLSNLARNESINAEECLQKANQKFIARFEGMVEDCKKDNIAFNGLSDEQMIALWQKQKRK